MGAESKHFSVGLVHYEFEDAVVLDGVLDVVGSGFAQVLDVELFLAGYECAYGGLLAEGCECCEEACCVAWVDSL